MGKNQHENKTFLEKLFIYFLLPIFVLTFINDHCVGGSEKQQINLVGPKHLTSRGALSKVVGDEVGFIIVSRLLCDVCT